MPLFHRRLTISSLLIISQSSRIALSVLFSHRIKWWFVVGSADVAQLWLNLLPVLHLECLHRNLDMFCIQLIFNFFQSSSCFWYDIAILALNYVVWKFCWLFCIQFTASCCCWVMSKHMQSLGHQQVFKVLVSDCHDCQLSDDTMNVGAIFLRCCSP